MVKKLFAYFSRNEIMLWCASVIFIVMSFCIFDRENCLALTASLRRYIAYVGMAM